MTKLNQQILELENCIPLTDKINENVSSGSIGWHTAHSLLTMTRVFESLEQSVPENYKYKFSIYKILVFLTKKIPKGKVRAPRIVRPEQFDTDSLQNQVESVKKNLAEIDTIKAKQFFAHPFLGDFRKKDALEFLEIHTEHHLKIIRDIKS